MDDLWDKVIYHGVSIACKLYQEGPVSVFV